MSGSHAITTGAPAFESRWPATLAVAAAIALYLTLPADLQLGPGWLLPAMEAAILVPLSVARPRRSAGEAGPSRMAAIALIGLANIGNVASLVLLIHHLLIHQPISGRTLLFSAIQIYMTNVIIFGLWYWELDGGGPVRRLGGNASYPDFLYPQMNIPEKAPPGWRPMFIDYLYVSLTNATAFSPTDTMPLTRRAKLLMGVQSIASLLTVALVAGRAVNILT
jgi:uncharacterized membrane protein